MKKILLSILFFGVICCCNAQDTFYVATNGNNANPGTLLSPFLTWEKLTDVMGAGDVGYIRGGRYPSPNGVGDAIHCLWEGIIGTGGSPCLIRNYPGESPIFDLSGMGTPTQANPVAVKVLDCEYLTVKGLRITGLEQHQGGNGISWGFVTQTSTFITHEQIELDSIGGYGFVTDYSDDATYLNCDAHHLSDPYSNPDPYGGSNGFQGTGGETSTRTVYDGCRAWWISDDGWDFFNTDGIRTIKNCWSFWNGYIPGTFDEGGNGQGFKLGPTATDRSTDTLKYLYNNFAFENRTNGFGQNIAQCLFVMSNNTAYANGANGFWWAWFNTIVQNFKNNCGYANVAANLSDAGSNVPAPYNSWNGTITVSDADFMSVSSAGMDGPRNSDGSLPYLPFMRLQTGSDLINAGNNVGLPFNNSAPDVNCFEYKRNNGRIF